MRKKLPVNFWVCETSILLRDLDHHLPWPFVVTHPVKRVWILVQVYSVLEILVFRG
jgi:hypothetical protein